MSRHEDARAINAYRRAGLVINRVQAQALADLLWEGKQAGATLADVEPPMAVALASIGRRESLGETLAQNRDGSHKLTEDGTRVAWEADPEAQTLAVVAEDGRAWQIVRAGIAWPVEPEQSTRP